MKIAIIGATGYVGSKLLAEALGSVDVSFTIALSRKMARHKACDEGNNALFPRSITQ